jgi:hypothetical protein
MTNKRQVGQQSLQAGRAQSPAATRAIDSSATRAYRGRGDLLVLVEPQQQGAPPAGLIATVIDQARDAYYGLGGSVTRGLRAAVLAANQALFDHNLRADSEHRASMGVVCAVLRDDDLYIAQLGPALALVVEPDGVAVYPSDFDWTWGGGRETAFPRRPGRRLAADVEPELFHHSLSAIARYCCPVGDCPGSLTPTPWRPLCGVEAAMPPWPNWPNWTATPTLDRAVGGRDVPAAAAALGRGPPRRPWPRLWRHRPAQSPLSPCRRRGGTVALGGGAGRG